MGGEDRTDEIEFEIWINEKRSLFRPMQEPESYTNGVVGMNEGQTRSDGGWLEWKTSLKDLGTEGHLSTPALIDLDGDGSMEVIIASAGDAIHALDPFSGAQVWDGPWTDDVILYMGQTPGTSGLDFNPPPFFSSVKAFDDNGTSPRIVVGVNDGVLCLDAEGNKVWRRGGTSGNYFATPCVTDLEGDFSEFSEMEIVAGSEDENRHSWIEALDIAGNQVMRIEAPTGGEGGLLGTPITAQDLDGSFRESLYPSEPDPGDERYGEIVFGTHDRGLRALGNSPHAVNHLDYRELYEGWLGGHQSYGSPAVANVTGTRECEIFIVSAEGYTVDWTGWGGKLYVYSPDGKKLWDYSTGSDRASLMSSPAIADLQVSWRDPDEEGPVSYEVVFGCDNGNLYVMDTMTHSLLWSFNTGGRCMSSPAICNIDNDDELEIIVGSGSGKVYCFDGDPMDGHDDGAPFEGDSFGHDVLWVYDAGADIGISSPVVADIDLDGMLEVVIGDTEGNVHCISAGGRCSLGQSDWPQFQCDLNNTGFYAPERSSLIDLRPAELPEEGTREAMMKRIVPGGTSTYLLELACIGDGARHEPLKIFIGADPNTVPPGWGIHIDTPPHGGDPNPDHVMVSIGDVIPLRVQVSAPLGFVNDTLAMIKLITFEDEDPFMRDSIIVGAILDLTPRVDVEFDIDICLDPLDPLYGNRTAVINPGSESTFAIIVRNAGNVNDSYVLNITEPPPDADWDWYFRKSGGSRAEVSLASPIYEVFGGVFEARFEIEVVCPGNAIMDTLVPLHVGVKSLLGPGGLYASAGDIATLRVSEYREFSLSLERSLLKVDPVESSGIIEVPIRASYMGNRLGAEAVMGFNASEGMDVTFDRPRYEFVPGQSLIAMAKVSFPILSMAGDRSYVRFLGLLEDYENPVDTLLTIEYSQHHAFAAEVKERNGLEISPGGIGRYNLTIKNQGNGPEEVVFEWSTVPADWTVRNRDEEGSIVERAVLPPWGMVIMEVLVVTSADGSSGPYAIKGSVSSDHGKCDVRLLAQILPVRGLGMYLDDGLHNRSIDVSPGDRYVSTLRVDNLGNGPEMVSLSLESMIYHHEMRFIAVSNTDLIVDRPIEVDLSTTISLMDRTGPVLLVPGVRSPAVSGLNLWLPEDGTAFVRFEIKAKDGRSGAGLTERIGMVASIKDGISRTVEIDSNILLPDLAIEGGIVLSGRNGGSWIEGDTITMIVRVVNIGPIPARDVEVSMNVDSRMEKTFSIVSLKPGHDEGKDVIFTWLARDGRHDIEIVVDPGDYIIEIVEGSDPFMDNNRASVSIRVAREGGVAIDTPILVTAIAVMLVLAVVGSLAYLSLRRSASR